MRRLISKAHILYCAIILLAAVFFSCAALKKSLRTVNDIAADLCMLVASEQDPKDLNGLTPWAWCAIHANLKPFIDSVLSAKADSMKAAGLKQ